MFREQQDALAINSSNTTSKNNNADNSDDYQIQGEENEVTEKLQLINAEATMRKKLNHISNENSEVGKLTVY